MMKKSLKYILAVAAFVSCSREDIPMKQTDDAIMFSVSAPGMQISKAEVANDRAWQIEDAVTAGTVGIRLHETLNQDYLYGQKLVPEITDGAYTGRWFPDVPPGAEKFQWKDEELVDGQTIKEVSFFAFGFSPVSAYGSNISVTQNSRGRDVTITQPASYSDEFIDYLLSYQINIPSQPIGANYPLIALELEHAMAKVELYVDCADVFREESDKYEIRFREVSFEGIYRKARLSCTHHAVSGTMDENVWSVEYDRTYTTDYSLPLSQHDDGEYCIMQIPEGNGDEPVKIMEFLAFPASFNMPYTLTISYDIVEKDSNGTVVEESRFTPPAFILRNYTPAGWQSGHKIKYQLGIDNGISLTGSVKAWAEMDYIEGVILPDINED